MILTSEYMGDIHFRIINDNREVIERLLERFRDHHVSKLGRIEFNMSSNEILEGDFLVRIFKANYLVPSFSLRPLLPCPRGDAKSVREGDGRRRLRSDRSFL